MLNGYYYRVTRNLDEALRQLISWQDRTKHYSYVWIDALCINQEDPQERNHQVKKMRSIYEQAECVMISLGEAAEDSHLAFELAEELVSLEETGQDSSAWMSSPDRTKHFVAFDLLLTRPYWSRVWVVQEVNSARRAEIMCGEDFILWTKLLQAQNIINSNQGLLWKLARDEPCLSDFPSDVWYEGPRGLLSHIGSQEPSLFEALRWHCTKVSSLAEDKVYAILGITSARDDPRIVIDYSRGVQQVYIDTTTYIIQSTKRLDIICGMQCTQRSNLGLPSWVIDWVDAYTSCLLDGSTGEMEAARSSEARVTFGQDGRSLTVEGMYLGTVSSVVDRLNPGDLAESFDLLEDFHRSRLLIGPPEEVPLSKLLTFCKTFTCGRILREVELLADGSDDDARRTMLGTFGHLAGQKGFGNLGQPSKELAESISHEFTNDYLETWGNVMLSDFKTILASRRFFICENGLQGSGLNQVVVGCKVCIFLGCATPVVVRPIATPANGDGGERFEVIGDAYIDGYMHGEALEELEQQKLELKKFVLI
ncbi:hypothetical protein EG329_006573 [Mollisiaceae sp. DMI_Dod_QoI]|nr:hypothetical protein EG329_006573 [Helotiales sp. DMI_Dod_QoI]